MEVLLRNDFARHYNLTTAVANIRLPTNQPYFEIYEDDQHEIQISTAKGGGTAVYRNDHHYAVVIINYDKFITSVRPRRFQQNEKRCDLIVYTNANHRYFLLNEISDTGQRWIDYIDPKGIRKGKRVKAISQLLSSLGRLMAVQAISNFANAYEVKRCCFFNKRAVAPNVINATISFNLINTITPNGFQMANTGMENLGFQLYEYSGGKEFVL